MARAGRRRSPPASRRARSGRAPSTGGAAAAGSSRSRRPVLLPERLDPLDETPRLLAVDADAEDLRVPPQFLLIPLDDAQAARDFARGQRRVADEDFVQEHQ